MNADDKFFLWLLALILFGVPLSFGLLYKLTACP